MARGDTTATQLGIFNISGAALTAALTGIAQGGMSGADVTSDLLVLPIGNGQVSVIKIARAAS